MRAVERLEKLMNFVTVGERVLGQEIKQVCLESRSCTVSLSSRKLLGTGLSKETVKTYDGF